MTVCTLMVWVHGLRLHFWATVMHVCINLQGNGRTMAKKKNQKWQWHLSFSLFHFFFDLVGGIKWKTVSWLHFCILCEVRNAVNGKWPFSTFLVSLGRQKHGRRGCFSFFLTADCSKKNELTIYRRPHFACFIWSQPTCAVQYCESI